jgi:protein-S-isoprenylcysteine O-methyltransferase Ste14
VFFALMLVVAMLARIPREEEDGYRRYGIAWYAYAKKSWKLIPFIY